MFQPIRGAGVASVRWLLIAVAAHFVCACARAPDLSGVRAEQAKAVQRYDRFQGAAANGNVIVVGGADVFLTSSDGGKSWDREQLPGEASILGVAGCPNGGFVAVDFYGKLWVRGNLPGKFRSHALPSGFSPVTVACDPRGGIWVAGSYSTLLLSADGGITWQTKMSGDDVILTTVSFPEATHGFVAGEFGTLASTDDGGETWRKQSLLPKDFYPYALLFEDKSHGWVTGVGGAVLRTRDGGLSWTADGSEKLPIYSLLSVDHELVGLGGGRRVLGLEGSRWQAIPDTPDVPADITAGVSLGKRTLLVVGAGGALQLVHLPVGSPLARVRFGEELPP